MRGRWKLEGCRAVSSILLLIWKAASPFAVQILIVPVIFIFQRYFGVCLSRISRAARGEGRLTPDSIGVRAHITRQHVAAAYLVGSKDLLTCDGLQIVCHLSDCHWNHCFVDKLLEQPGF